MSKKVLAIGLTIVGIALIATGIGAPLGAFAIAGATITVASVVGTVLLVAASVLLGPSVPKVPGSLSNGARERLFSSLNPTAPRKILFGDTAGATDVRYQTYTGIDQEYLEQIVCVASHKINSIYELWLDNEKVWSSAGGVTSKFSGFLTVVTRAEGTSANGIAIDGNWTASCTLTGCAYLHAKYKLTGPDDATASPFSSGVSQRMTVRCKGAFVYDPRLDSTVSGGSGTQRAATQSTWAWGDNASRNPALELLFFLLGWKINGKLAVGMGLPASRIDLPSFITGANLCDESVTKNGGGTEPRYRSDGVLAESDDRRAVVESLCAAMNAVVRDSGGKLALYVLHNDLGTPVASFTENDVLAGIKWSQTPDINATFNIVRGHRTDPSDQALYQPIDYAEVPLTAPDGIDRITTVDYPLVQSNGQAQRLAKQFLQRNQYQGRAALTGKPSWWQVSVGDVIRFSHTAFGWSSKLFRVAGQKISRSGETETILVEENSSIYAWDNSESPPVTAGDPTVYDWRNHPIVRGIGEARLTTGNMLRDTEFSRRWTLAAGAVRKRADSDLGYAKGDEKFYLELSPNSSTVVSGLSDLVRVNPGQKYFFSFRAQRGATLGSGSRLNAGGQWIGADGTTVVGAFTEAAQQTPTTLTAGALPKEVAWSGTAPATANYVQLKLYTPALASSSGTFRVEKPWVSITDPGGTPSITAPATTYAADYNADGSVVSGELPFDIGATLLLGAVPQTAGVTWSYKVKGGSVNGHSSGSTVYPMSGTGSGILTVTALGADKNTVELTGTAANGSSATLLVAINKNYGAASPGAPSGGDSSSQGSGFTGFSSSTFSTITNTLLYTMPSGATTATVTFNISCKPAKSGTTPPWTIQFKIQRNIAGTWTDVGTTLSASSDLTDTDEIVIPVAAIFSGTRQSTGLSAGTQYQWRAQARISAGTTGGAGQHNVTGSISVANP